ncbi:hypothetical protein [Exiguobacterium sp. 17-1]|uniref:hypothetical protein n=1 Tax=Exiguobacterium sp. 17-1 TaxID=2931981 RepID=UPI002000298C|nr:hypothetical protein [Exiguobacterium sp. 17-1]MCK2157313.1 hypothetical protein [Exiguobacterium sp. 17-1]
MLKKITVVLLTSVLVSGILTYCSYTPVSERAGDTMYTSASGIFILYLIYALPIILISGFLTDVLIRNRLKHLPSRLRFFVLAVLYGLSGVLIGMFLILTLSKEDFDIPASLAIAGGSALLYYLVTYLIERAFRRLDKKETPVC